MIKNYDKIFTNPKFIWQNYLGFHWLKEVKKGEKWAAVINNFKDSYVFIKFYFCYKNSHK